MKLQLLGRGVAAILAFALRVHAADGDEGRVYFVDPVHGSMSNDGSAEHPWRTLQEVFDGGLIETRKIASNPWVEGVDLVPKNEGAPVKAGDTLRLRSGYHGEIEFFGGYNTDTITIEADAGHSPELKRLRLVAASNWVIRGLVVSPSTAPDYSTGTLIKIENHSWHGPSHDVVVEQCRLYSVADSSAWTLDDWNSKSCSGISVGGKDCVVRGNHLLNVNFGISCGGEKVLVEHNVVENFSGDGLRGLGDFGVFQFNTIKNCYDVNANHDDGFQSWSVGPEGVGTGVVKGIVLRGNIFLNYSDPEQPFRGTLQGIGCFDGMFEDWVVENNIVIVNHWHGISLYGAKNCRLLNNTVIDIDNERPGPPWIRVAEHKNGTPSTGCIIRNNLSTAYTIGSDPSMIADHNLTVADPADHFRDVPSHDLRLKEDSPAIDAGSPDQTPTSDIRGVPRSLGEAPDAGAHEFAIDEDQDGMADWWETKFFGSKSSPKGGASEDWDGDGTSNLEEFEADTDPTNALSQFKIMGLIRTSGALLLKWTSECGKTYQIESAASPSQGFEPHASGISGVPPENAFAITPVGNGSGFFRVAVDP